MLISMDFQIEQDTTGARKTSLKYLHISIYTCIYTYIHLLPSNMLNLAKII